MSTQDNVEVFELKLTITEPGGRTHVLDVMKKEGQAAVIEMLGNNLKLTARLQMALDAVQRDFGGRLN